MHSFIESVSGFLGAAISVTACSPLDVMRVRYQVQGQFKAKYKSYLHTMNKIMKEEGTRGFYRGYSIAVISIPLFNCIYFPLYEFLKDKLQKNNEMTLMRISLASGISGLASNIMLNPLWIIKTRIQANIFNHISEQCSNPLKMLQSMIKEEGLRSLLKGIVPSLFGILHPMIYFPCYEYLKNLFHRKLHLANSLTIVFSTMIGKGMIIM